MEGDEQCDAGLLGTEDNDACCDKNCKLRKNQGAVCRWETWVIERIHSFNSYYLFQWQKFSMLPELPVYAGK